MEKLANRIAESAANSAGLDEERRQVIAYGLGALLQMLLLMASSFVFGFLFHCIVEAMIIFVAVGLFKRSAGGAHSRTSGGCTCISLASIFLMALFSRYVVPSVPALWPVYLVPATLTYAYAFITTYRLAPVASANKPIVRKEKVLRLRRLSFLTITVFAMISLTLICLGGTYPRCINAAISLCMAVLWQSFMLTKTAERFIGYLDSPGSTR